MSQKAWQVTAHGVCLLLSHYARAALAVEGGGEVIDVGDYGDRVGVRRVSDEIDGRFDFRPHRADAELVCVQVRLDFVGGDLFEPLFVRFSKVDGCVLDGGEDDERRRFEVASQQAGGAVLIDNGRDAANAAV